MERPTITLGIALLGAGLLLAAFTVGVLHIIGLVAIAVAALTLLVIVFGPYSPA